MGRDAEHAAAKVNIEKPGQTLQATGRVNRREQVAAMIEFCRADPMLEWLRGVIIGLATTGMRIGELAGLRWADIDFDANVVKLADERFSHRRNELGHARKIKGKRSRSIPLNSAFRDVLEQIPRHPDGLVFHRARGGRIKPDVVCNVLVREATLTGDDS